MEDVQETDRIRAPGHADNHDVPPIEHPVTFDRPQSRLDNRIAGTTDRLLCHATLRSHSPGERSSPMVGNPSSSSKIRATASSPPSAAT